MGILSAVYTFWHLIVDYCLPIWFVNVLVECVDIEIAYFLLIMQHFEQRGWPRGLWASSRREGLLLCQGRPYYRNDSYPIKGLSGKGELCILVSFSEKYIYGWNWINHSENTLPEDQWWSGQRICTSQVRFTVCGRNCINLKRIECKGRNPLRRWYTVGAVILFV